MHSRRVEITTTILLLGISFCLEGCSSNEREKATSKELTYRQLAGRVDYEFDRSVKVHPLNPAVWRVGSWNPDKRELVIIYSAPSIEVGCYAEKPFTTSSRANRFLVEPIATEVEHSDQGCQSSGDVMREQSARYVVPRSVGNDFRIVQRLPCSMEEKLKREGDTAASTSNFVSRC
jgi:hypothetical protein